MAVRKVNHKKRIVSKTLTSIGDIKIGDIVEFIYRSENNQDKRPMVFVLFKRGKILNGINISYLKEYAVRRLTEEINYKRLRYWELYEKAFRTYTISKIRLPHIVEYETAKEQREENRDDVEDKLNEA